MLVRPTRSADSQQESNQARAATPSPRRRLLPSWVVSHPAHSIAAMAWGTIELEQEVEAWLLALPDELFGQAERYIDLLADEGVHLDEPFTRQLRGKLRELRFHLGRQQTRITYYIATGRRIVLLTVFVKTRQRERLEVQRAWRAMQTCIAEGHTAEDDE